MERHIIPCIILTLTVVSPCESDRSFTIDHERKVFLKDGQPFRFLSGEMHYFRVPKEYWRDRLNKIKMAGLDVVASYIEWSSHEPEPGVYNFDDIYDLEGFLREIKNQGLLAILRPGPFIGAERDYGGFPYWLLKDRYDRYHRSSDKDFLKAVDNWFGKLLPILRRHLYKNGGPIIAVQVENEYGHYYRCDKSYMEHLISLMEKHMGKDVVYFRADFPYTEKYECDKARDILVAGDMADNADVARSFATIKRANPRPGPIFVAEYYTGWKDYWGWWHNRRGREPVLTKLEEMMKRNASVNLYMFVGGTNFGFKAGSGGGCPVTTSYDYEAPVAEHGDVRITYHAVRALASYYLGRETEGPLLLHPPKLHLGAVQLSDYVSLEDVMDHFRQKNWLIRKETYSPRYFKDLGQDYGYVVYRTKVNTSVTGLGTVSMAFFVDRAYLRVDGKLYKFYGRCVSTGKKQLEQRIPLKTGDDLAFLTENIGRECYDFSAEPIEKGIRWIYLNDVPMKNWTMEAVPMNKKRDVDELFNIVRRKGDGKVPGFFHGTFTLPKGQKPLDTFLDPRGWGKGVAFINGVNLGRYWPGVGPQVTLYVPGPYLKPHPEENRLMLFETEEAPATLTVSLVNKPLLDANIETPKY